MGRNRAWKGPQADKRKVQAKANRKRAENKQTKTSTNNLFTTDHKMETEGRTSDVLNLVSLVRK